MALSESSVLARFVRWTLGDGCREHLVAVGSLCVEAVALTGTGTGRHDLHVVWPGPA